MSCVILCITYKIQHRCKNSLFLYIFSVTVYFVNNNILNCYFLFLTKSSCTRGYKNTHRWAMVVNGGW